MKKTYLIIATALLLSAMSARAQLSSSITSHQPGAAIVGSDYWFAFPSNQWGVNLGGKYMKIFITAPSNCNASVAFEGNTNIVPITAYNISTFAVPEAWEMESSGIVENKGIHVYCNTPGLSVSFISYNANSSDGSYVIPTIGWGKDYVVAAAGSLFEGNGTGGFDYPSECVIVADEDNTVVSITPTCNCRKSTSGNGSGDANSTVVAFPAGETFNVTLNRGQSMQLMPVKATDPDNFDLSGTIIHANNPIGMIGGSMLINLPADFQYANFVCEMIPPIRTWGETYYAPSFIEPPGTSGHDYTRYLFIASEANQVIYRHECDSTNDIIECTIREQYGVYWDELERGQKFFSNAPFLVVGYLNSASYPDGNNGDGSASEFTINTHEGFLKDVTFETPSGTEFTNYASIVCNVKAANNTTFDGKGVTGLPAACIDDTFAVFSLDKIAPGSHRITSDSGVAVYIYGYGYDESYAWTVPGAVATFHSPDTIPPHADTSSECDQGFVHLSDSGFLPDGVDTQSGLADIVIDSSYNMAFLTDANFIDGSGVDTSGYSMTVIDPTLPAILTVEVSDIAGNVTTVTSIYTPIIDSIKPPLQNLGVQIMATPNIPNIAYDTLYNMGMLPFDITELQLLKGNVGFTIFDSIGGPLDLSPLPAGGRRVIQIEFEAVIATAVIDSIIFGGECGSMSVAVIGSGGANDFLVTSQTWMNEPLGNCYPKTVEIENLSSTTITIDSAWWSDTTHFKAVTDFPVMIAAGPGKVAFIIEYCPDSNSQFTHDSTEGSWFSPNVLATDGSKSPRFDILTGWAAAPSSVNGTNNSSIQATILPTNDGRSIEIILPSNLNSPVTFELVNVLGESVLRSTLGVGTQNVDASSLPRGVYFYRLTSGPMNQSGKVILGE